MTNTRAPASLARAAYADMFGPTVGDRIRLADTSLLIEVEKDFTTYGEEVKSFSISITRVVSARRTLSPVVGPNMSA